MNQVLFTARSVTRAQRMAAILSRRGLRCGVFRAPTQLSQHGCTYAVRLERTHISVALELLSAEGLSPLGIYEKTDTGYREVLL